MLKQSRLHKLGWLLACCLVTSTVFAEEEDASVDPDEASTGTETVMMHQPATVMGFQPLSVAGQDIDAAYIEETLGERHGAIVLFHDRGEAFESQGVVTPLRQQLPEYGWSTLTVSYDLPAETSIMLSATLEQTDAGDGDTSQETPTESEADDAATLETEDKKAVLPPVPNLERVEAALVLLQAKEIERVIFVGHGDGARLAIEMLDSKTMPVDGVVLVGLPAQSDIKERFEAIEIPVLDIYGGQDLPAVMKGVKQRKAMMKRVADSDYTVRKVLGANHVYYGMEPRLVSTLRSWLNAKFIKQVSP